MSGRLTENGIAGREIVSAMIGTATGAAILIAASAYGFNRLLVFTAMMLSWLTAWSALQWHRSNAGPVPEERLRQDRSGRSSHEQATIKELPVSGSAARMPTASASPTSVTQRLQPDQDAPAGEMDAQSATEGHSRVFVPLDDLKNDLQFREFQCGACASYDVMPGSDHGRELMCGRCGTRTELDGTGRPHAIVVRSNAARSNQNTKTPQPITAQREEKR